ncbi:MAG: hypothetical protein KA004_17415 [Verrucomicrobiales bacterium]|nr:hypothetical protein [Verrucomicrobiales bacterium]
MLTSFAQLSIHLHAPMNLEGNGLVHPILPGLLTLPVGTGADYVGVSMDYANGVDATIDFTELSPEIGGSSGLTKTVEFQSIHGAVLQVIRTGETVSGTVTIASTPLKWASHTISPGGSPNLLALTPVGRALHVLAYAGTAIGGISSGAHLTLDFSDAVGFKVRLQLYGQYAD